jgi:3-oxoacyl-[acyl-carrier protein] reductase
MELGLAGRVYLVTGGSRGLGRATVDALVGEGANVVVTGRSHESLRRVESHHGAAVRTVVADNAAADTPARLIDAAQESFGRVDGALISVGGPPAGQATDIGDDAWRASFESVFLGAVRIAREVSAELDSGGALALVLSTSVRQPIPGLAISNGLRPGLAMVAKTLADELGPRGIRVNALLPGRIATDRVAELDAATGDVEAARELQEALIPLRRYGDPAEFATAAAFLLSPAASYLTGVMLPVDGGLGRGL